MTLTVIGVCLLVLVGIFIGLLTAYAVTPGGYIDLHRMRRDTISRDEFKRRVEADADLEKLLK